MIITLALIYLFFNIYMLTCVSYRKLSKKELIIYHLTQMIFATTLIILYSIEKNIFCIFCYIACLIVHVVSLNYFRKWK
jgi:hypothetical protein